MGVPWWPHLHKINKGSKPLKTFLLVQEGDRSDKLNLVAANAECMVKVLTCQEKRHLARCIAAVLSGISFFSPMPLRLFSTPFGCRSCQVILALVQRRPLLVKEGHRISLIVLCALTGVPGSWCGLTQLNLHCPLLRKCLRHCQL